MKNIYLIGFMGTGKTTTGKLLADRLSLRFVDLDKEIERVARRTIPEIFRDHGEAYFRRLEKEETGKVTKCDHLVVATGGGTVKDAENRRRLHETGIVIALLADVETVFSRTSTKGERPILDDSREDSRKQAIEALLAERKAFYEDCHFSVDTTDKTPEEVAARIIEVLKKEYGYA